MNLSIAILLTLLVGSGTTAAAEGRSDMDVWARSGSFLPSSLFGQVGRAKETSTLTLGAQWDWARRWQVGERSRVSGYSEISIGQWRADQGGSSAIVTQLGFTPAFRYWPAEQAAGWFYEGAIGVNLVAPVYRTKGKRLSTVFNFGDHLAIGYRERGSRGLEWSLRLQRFSNAGIQHPNPGENFVQFRLVVPLSTRW
jgi:hypothetical protein